MSDRKITDVMVTHANDALRYARQRFKDELDFTPASLERVDRMLDVIHHDLPKNWLERVTGRGLSKKKVWEQSKMWGGYIGETLRRRWGGQWRSRILPSGEVEVSMQILGVQLHPIDEVRRRLVEGTGDGAIGMLQLVQAHSHDDGIGQLQVGHEPSPPTITPLESPLGLDDTQIGTEVTE